MVTFFSPVALTCIKIAGELPGGVHIQPFASVTFKLDFMKKKTSLTLLFALLMIAGASAQKKQYSHWGNNDGYEQYRNDQCHSNSRGKGHHKGKHKKHQHKNKHCRHDDWNNYGHHGSCCNDHDRERNYGYHERDHDYGYHERDDKRNQSGPRTNTPTRRGRSAIPMAKPTRNPAPRTVETGRTVNKPAAPIRTVRTSKDVRMSSGKTTAPTRRNARPRG